MPPAVRKVALTVHVVASVGWLGAVVAFGVLAVTAVRAQDDRTAQALFIAMEVLGVAALVPLSIASLMSGLVQALGTTWGLVRHYWVIVKLAITVLATAVLMMYLPALRVLADGARAEGTGGGGESLPTWSPVLHAAGALALLLTAVVLSVHKPKGLTPWGWRAQQTPPRRSGDAAAQQA